MSPIHVSWAILSFAKIQVTLLPINFWQVQFYRTSEIVIGVTLTIPEVLNTGPTKGLNDNLWTF